jgi:hypothetical protein
VLVIHGERDDDPPDVGRAVRRASAAKTFAEIPGAV